MFRVYAITYKRETIGIAHVVGNMRMTKSDAAEAFWNDPHVNKTRDESHVVGVAEAVTAGRIAGIEQIQVCAARRKCVQK
jgi:hypothetical protein